MNRTEQLIQHFHLQKHPEGGWFSEVFTTDFQKDDRSLAGSIYFLLDRNDLSHFHVIDCDEIWYYHEGCGMRILCLNQNGDLQTLKLGMQIEKGEEPMAVLKAGTVFAAENLDTSSYTFVSCATTPQFTYEGFHLCSAKELLEKFPGHESMIRKYCMD